VIFDDQFHWCPVNPVTEREVILLTDIIKQYGKVTACVLALLAGILFPAAWTVQAGDKGEAGQLESAQPPAGEESEKLVSVDFNDVDLTVFIKFISEVTGKNFVVDEHIKDKITIISPSKITVEEAYQVFESVLEVHGYTTVKSGKITKIVKDMDARSKSIETGLAGAAGNVQDKMVTQIIPLKYADTNEVKQLFVPLVSKAGVILSYPSTSMLIITDYHSNIKRLMNIIRVIDVTGIGRQVSVTPLEFSDATKMVPILESVFQSKPARGKPVDDGVRMVADDRSNSIVLLASEIETKQIKQLIALLDRKVPQGKEGIHVVYLKNADAEEMMEVLLNLPKGEEKTTGAKKAPIISEDVSITADSATNSLIIMAERDDYLVLKEIIDRLDIPRSMVYIECLIVEVNVNKEFNLGAEWMAGGKTHYYDRDGAYLGGFGGASETGYPNIYGMVASGTGVASLPPGFSVGAFNEAITIGDVIFPNVAAVVQAYRKDKDVNILSTPQIMTTDNTEASITVGKNIPYLTRIGTTDASETYSNYEYNDVGIMLTIKPQINENRLIRLDISQEVTRLDQLSTVAADRPSTLKRTINTNVIVHDHHTIVIGGLIDDTLTQVEYKIPCLGSVPLAGWFFKGISDSNDRTNLFVFLTPHVIKSIDEADIVLRDKQAEMDSVTKGGFNLFPAAEEGSAQEDPTTEDKWLFDDGGDVFVIDPSSPGENDGGTQGGESAPESGKVPDEEEADNGRFTEDVTDNTGDSMEDVIPSESDEEENVIKNVFFDRDYIVEDVSAEAGADSGETGGEGMPAVTK